MEEVLCTYQLRTAITWHIACELMRRHKESCDLFVLERHPGGGQYDCLALFSHWHGDHHNTLCDFNQQSQHLHVWGHLLARRAELSDLGWRDGNDYVLAYLSDPARTISQIEDLLGLPRYAAAHHPPTTPPVLTIHLISALLDRFALGTEVVLAFMGYEDTSGEGGGLRDALKHYPAVMASLSAETSFDPALERRAAKFWFLSTVKDQESPPVLLDMRGKLYAIANPNEPWDFWHEYQVNGRELRPIVNRIEELI